MTNHGEDKYDISKRKMETELYISTIRKIKNNFNKNVKYLEPLEDLPHMEPRLKKIFIETYLMTACGFSNVSLILQGVLLEQLVKEVIFANERKEFQQAFGPAIKRCNNNEYMNKHEIRYLNNFKNKIRNYYQHGDVSGLTKNRAMKGWKVKIGDENPAKILSNIEKSIKDIRAGNIVSTDYSVKEVRPIGLMIKNIMDEQIYFNEFMFMDIFVRKICGKYMPP